MHKIGFGASEFCRLTGISGETLRHYVDCGLIDSVEIDANNYKRYTAKNAMDVLHARMCRGLDFPIPNIIHKAEVALDEQESLLLVHRERLEAEERQLRLKLERMNQQIELMRFTREQLGRVVERSAEKVPALYRLLLIGDGAAPDSRALRVAMEWMEKPQYTHVAIRAPIESLRDPSVDELPMSLGIGIRESFVKELDLDVSPPVVCFPQNRNIGTVVSTYDPLHLRKSDFPQLFEKVDSLGCEIVSDLAGRLCTYLETDKGRLYYFTVSICIR